ncbi:TlpA family protein disulfide reductase [Lysobacter sp. BMK333-48F3]|uniref:TlpA family protein disulfide reductase n=1 Tax=Lysobacter sp. BMK333-48F3 TaxID=2867962 RepID=UPI001C8C824D|nr:TlpA family protein disulfide reductase [Lysobacter sp. BMK333-48F3]
MSRVPASSSIATVLRGLFAGLLLAWCGAAGAQLASAPLSAPPSSDASAPRTALRIGQAPPEWLGLDRQGRSLQVGQYRGRALLVVFWASWCGQCRSELPLLSALRRGFGRERLAVVAINHAEPRRDFDAFVRLNPGLDFDFVHDPGPVARHYGVRAVPQVFLIDAQGRLVHQQRGYSPQKIEALARELRKRLPASGDAG